MSDELRSMAERYAAWCERNAEQRGGDRRDAGIEMDTQLYLKIKYTAENIPNLWCKRERRDILILK